MGKNMVRSYGVLAILFVVFTVVVVAVPLLKNAVFWVAYVFAAASMAVQGYAIHCAFGKVGTVTSKFYGFPIAKIGFVYMVAQLIISVASMLLAGVLEVWIPVVISAVALGAAGIGLITTDAMREEIQRQDQVLKKDVSLMRGLQSKSRMMIAHCQNPAQRAQLDKLSQALQYSDPVSNEAIAHVEYQLTQLVDELEKAVVEQDDVATEDLCQKTMKLLEERNQLCKLNKQH